jgi:DNA-binding PadR family transcriptional regulator
MEYSDPEISEREAAVLGLLAENPLYGYTIEKKISERGMRHWTDIGFSSIYYVLKRLEHRQLITSSCEQQEDKPARKIYTITEEGRERIQMKVRQLLARSRRVASPFDLGISNLWLLSRDEAVLCLEDRTRALDEALSHVETLRSRHAAEEKPYFVLALFDRAAAHLRTEREWLLAFIGEVKDHATT